MANTTAKTLTREEIEQGSVEGLAKRLAAHSFDHVTYDQGTAIFMKVVPLDHATALLRTSAQPQGWVSVPLLETEEMQDAARGILQILRSRTGCTEHDVFLHCKLRGDDTEGLHENDGSYVTEARAAAMIYRAMVRAAPQSGAAPAEPVIVGRVIRCIRCGGHYPASAPAEKDEARDTDTRRLDWLETMTVNRTAAVRSFAKATPTHEDALDRAESAESRLAECEKELAEKDEARDADTRRLDWLEKMVVNVRVPLVYGSRDLFWASPRDIEGDEDEPSDIRARIDKHRCGERFLPPKGES